MREPPQMRWWGWGDPEHPDVLSPRALELLRERVGTAQRPLSPVALEAVKLARGRLSDRVRDALVRILGLDAVREDRRERVTHAAGKGYLDLVRMRAGAPRSAPDAVVLPASHEQLRSVLELCAGNSVAVVPFGGGTSVVGGVEPVRGEHDAVIALDMRRIAELEVVDERSRLVRVGGGMRAPALEGSLAARGLTLGHWPQSFEYVSLGGCVATRSAGQASSGYGSIAQMVLGVRLSAPGGDIDLAAMPASTAGPGLRELIVGSEGALGVIDQVALRVRSAPAHKHYEGVLFDSFDAGLEGLRALAQRHTMPDVARLSDPQETWLSLTLAQGNAIKGWLQGAYLNVRGFGAHGRCLAILGFEGERYEVAARRARARRLLRRCGALALGRSPGEAWRRARFEGPYLRDELLGHGVMVETLETATRWSNIERLWRAVAGAIEEALRNQGTPGIVMCHVSHLYETGASLYYTLIARQRDGAQVEQWRALKRAASEAIVAHGGTITHHHALGRDHAPWLARELGSAGVAAIRALKAQLDPAGIMNPGKLLQ